MIDGEALDPHGEEVVAALADVLSASVGLMDLDEERSHAFTARGWISYRTPASGIGALVLDRAQTGQSAFVRVNRRWILRVVSETPLPAETNRMMTWAGEKLGHHLPAATRYSATAPAARGGGGGPSNAELGIPPWWSRKGRA
jgi:hypothetical protein